MLIPRITPQRPTEALAALPVASLSQREAQRLYDALQAGHVPTVQALMASCTAATAARHCRRRRPNGWCCTAWPACEHGHDS
jgi:hypothetical protein